MKNCSFSRELIEQETLRETEFSPLLFVASSKRLEKVKGKQEKAGVHVRPANSVVGVYRVIGQFVIDSLLRVEKQKIYN